MGDDLAAANVNRSYQLAASSIAIFTFLLFFLYPRFASGEVDALWFQATLIVMNHRALIRRRRHRAVDLVSTASTKANPFAQLYKDQRLDYILRPFGIRNKPLKRPSTEEE